MLLGLELFRRSKNGEYKEKAGMHVEGSFKGSERGDLKVTNAATEGFLVFWKFLSINKPNEDLGKQKKKDNKIKIQLSIFFNIST